MKKMTLLLVLVCLGYSVCLAEPAAGPKFKKIQLTNVFYCEGAYFADFNKDGKMDIVSGPFWYQGPDFQAKHQIREPKAYDPKNYSDNFLTYTGDFNGDGWPDVFYCPFPGAEGFWYENPAGKEGPWKKHLALKQVDNESPMWQDVNGDGRPDLLFNTGGCLGYATYDTAKPDEMWTFHAITPKGKYQRFTHGIGLGDINGDGRPDILEGEGWWEQPADAKDGQPWTKHAFKFADAACQMYGCDVDGDGKTDVITSWHCHAYGLLWWKQVKNEKGEISFERKDILPSKPDLKSPDLRISQLHAIDLADFNGDGVKDILTGKRFWSHGPTGDVEPGAPAVVYWFECRRGPDGVKFIPHLIDDDSGVGTQVAACDLNGDGIPDVIVGNKKGTFVHLSQK